MVDPLGEIMGKGKKPKKGKKSELSGPPEADDSDESATLEELEAKMKAAAARLDFEEAARLRDIIRDRKD